MFNIKKKNNHNDLSLYLSDNHTTGTIDFYRKKSGGMMPDYLYQIMEANARKEYDDADVQAIKEKALREKTEYENKLLAEYALRASKDYNNKIDEEK